MYRVWMLAKGAQPEIVGYDAKWDFETACEICRRLWKYGQRAGQHRIYYVVRPVK
jgi:hypothetical protein